MIYRYYPYTLTLHAPVILNSSGGDPNSAATLSYIPGGALRGIVAGVLGDPGFDAGRLADFKSLVLSDGVCYLNAYPTDSSRRALPAPTSFRTRKGVVSADFIEVLDLAAFSGEINDLSNDWENYDIWPQDSLDSFPYPYVSIGAAQLRGIRPDMGSRIHHQRDRNGKESQIFTYEYLEAGQELAGLIRIFGPSEAECDSRFNRIRELLVSPLLLGRSRRARYGGNATITWGQPQNREVTGERVIKTDVDNKNQFRVLFLSPCVVRDGLAGQLDPVAIESELRQRLGQRAQVIRKRWAFDFVGGFNRKWRLELPQAKTVAAGSVLVLEALDKIPHADILRIEHEGLGERLAEGFGRIVFLDEPNQRLRVEVPTRRIPSKPKGNPSELVQFIERRVLENAAHRIIDEETALIACNVRQIPTPSLIGRLRVPLRGNPAVGLRTLREWLSEGPAALRRPACDQLERCHLQVYGRNTNLKIWMKHLADNGYDNSRLQVLAQENYVISEDAAQKRLLSMREALTIRFLDAVLEALARRKRKEASDNASE